MKRARIATLENPFHARATSGAVVRVTHAIESFAEASGEWLRFGFSANRETAVSVARAYVNGDALPAGVAELAAAPEPLPTRAGSALDKLASIVGMPPARLRETILNALAEGADNCTNPDCLIHGKASKSTPDPRAN